eukprot:4641047-Amphidinium_carterae.1
MTVLIGNSFILRAFFCPPTIEQLLLEGSPTTRSRERGCAPRAPCEEGIVTCTPGPCAGAAQPILTRSHCRQDAHCLL